MKTTFLLSLILLCTGILAQDAKEIVIKAENKMQGESSTAEMEMKIIRPSWERTVVFKTWGKGRDFSLSLITEPAKEKGQSFLKRYNDMWSWNPTINRMIKLPPSMLSQGWMGSDYTNDDIMKESSIVKDYTHKIIGNESVAGLDCYKIELIPLEDAAVVWGKIILWISKTDFYEMKVEFYDEEEELIKTHVADQIKFMHDRKIPTVFEIIPADKPSQKTIVTIKNIQFNVTLPETFFSQQNMKTVK